MLWIPFFFLSFLLYNWIILINKCRRLVASTDHFSTYEKLFWDATSFYLFTLFSFKSFSDSSVEDGQGFKGYWGQWKRISLAGGDIEITYQQYCREIVEFERCLGRRKQSVIFRRWWRIQTTMYIVDERFMEASENILRGSLLTLISLFSNWGYFNWNYCANISLAWGN